LTAALFAFSVPAMAAEHPEHPQKKAAKGAKGAKAAEHPAKTAASTVALEDVAVHIEQWVAGQNGGEYVIEDTHAKKTLTLTLDKIHRERLSGIGDDTYFVCADFKTAEGTVYDLDFFVKGTSKADLKLVAGKTSVHKESGNARYTWSEKDGVWSTSATAGSEHPDGEHPKDGKDPAETSSEHPEHPE
jgi:hypothetical protein